MEKIKLSDFIKIVLVCAVLSHLMIPQYFISQIIQSVGLVLVFLVIYTTTLRKGKIFLFVMIIFIFSHFQFGANQGGAYNIIALLTMLFGIIPIINYKNLNKLPSFMILLLVLFFASNIAGWSLNDESNIIQKLLGALSLLGFLSVFTLVSKINLKKEHIRVFLITNTVMLIWMTFVSINMRYDIFTTKSLLFGVMSAYSGSIRVASTLSFATSGEYAMLSLMILFPFFLSKFSKYELNVKNKYYYFAFASIFILIIMTQNRSILLLSIGYLLLFYIIMTLRVSGKLFGLSKFYYILIAFALLFILSGSFLQFDVFMDRINELSFSSLTEPESYSTGDQINRSYTTLVALQRIAQRPWIFGFGWGNMDGNLLAWFGPYFTELSDPHSLYYSIIPIFGWTGSVFFLLIIIYTLIRLIKAILKYQNENSYLMILIYCFTFLFIFLMVNQFKQSVLNEAGYFMIFWIWLGLANASVTSLNRKNSEES